ncbi:hypothetical protein L218DRAFT_1005222 [Marasmius fiardii PR-910]|nr:hypothetical protein L218DRAFT_1005222 [Marasmius fiardii PR-910]
MKKQARLSKKPYEKLKKPTLAQSSVSGTPTPPVQSVVTAATTQSNHVAAPTAGNNNSSINFFGDGMPVASGSGATSTSGTSGASVGLEEHGVDVNGDVDDEREDELAGEDAGNGNPMQLDG